ncbi:MAG: GerMN domain-containing protein [Clostridiales bacterium]|nr:GerMN domain-containing protein [Clostridiales bacterium]
MTRLFINLFFIVIVCFTLAVLPINTAALELFDFEGLFSNEEPEIVEETPVDEAFKAEYTVTYENINNRLYNPDDIKVVLKTNIPKSYENDYDFNDITLALYQNDKIFQILNSDKFVSNSQLTYDNDLITVNYTLTFDYYTLELNRDGFFDAEINFDASKNIPSKVYQLAYRPDIDYVNNGSAQNNGNFIYKAFFKNVSGTHLVPLYFSVKYPESITVEVRNRLYNPPPLGYGLSENAIIPERSNISKIGDKHYGVFLYTNEINKVIETKEEAQLAIDALVKSLTRLPHINKLTIFVDDVQVEGSLFDIDLKTVYEQTDETYVYLTERNATTKRYLIPVEISEDNVYDEILSIFSVLKTGYIDNKQWIQIIPPEVEMDTFMIEGTTITADFNEAFLNSYTDQPEYRRLMINSILYSFTSNPNINKVLITVNGQPVTDFGGYDFTEAQQEPSYINFIGDY